MSTVVNILSMSLPHVHSNTHYTDALALPLAAYYFGAGLGPILIDDLTCTGDEEHLIDCPSRPYGEHDCTHNEDAGLYCP